MPGIVGFTAPLTSDPNAPRILQRMQDMVTHFDSYQRAPLFSDEMVGVTHSDKAIIQRGPQPFEKDGVFVWFDGELFKRDRLAVGRSTAEAYEPTEIMCRLFQEDPHFSFLKRIDGIYSCVIYDSLKGMVHLITDRYGLRYLYWSIFQEGLVWASELKAMLALPGFQPKIERDGVPEFMIDGYLWGNRSWFQGVHLLAPGTVLTWNIEKRSAHEYQYWGWQDIRPRTGRIDETEVADEMAALFIDAVKSRCLPGERIGVLLSGGLDSRALLAATPVRDQPVLAVTFGKADCVDCQIAERAAQVKGAPFRLLELTKDNFMDGRLAGVWWNDGQPSLLDMHVSTLLPQGRNLCDIFLDGFLGDVFMGGSYLKPFGKGELWKIENRGRRFIVNGPRYYGTWLEYRLPFADNDLIDLLMSLPREVRAKHHLYKIMLLRTFRELYEDIPWFDTMAAIKLPRMGAQGPLLKHRWVLEWFVTAIQRRLNRSRWQRLNYTDYPEWIRKEPAKSFFASVLTNASALYPEFVSRDQVVKAWKEHLEGADHAKMLFLHVTFEIWLQQVFEGRFRPGADGVPYALTAMMQAPPVH
jgi:asparagine synthase (glutamine-hydrolysing)